MRATVALAALVALAAGCGEASAPDDATLRVYVSVPERGPDARAGQDIAAGAELALADAGGEADEIAVEAIVLDNTGGDGPEAGWTQARVAANARTATRDSTTIGYIGEHRSASTRVSLPITNSAGIPQLSAGASALDLTREETFNDAVPTRFQTTGERTFVRVIDSDGDNGLAEPLDPGRLPRSGQRVVSRLQVELGREPGPYAAYGYEAMALLLDAIERADDPTDRGAIVDALLATLDRESVLGTYSIDADTGEAIPER